MKKLFSLFIIIFLILTGCGNNTTIIETTVDETTAPVVNESELVVLFTNDIHGVYQRDDDQGQLGFAALASYADSLVDSGKQVVLIDGGDAIQGEAVATLSKGSYIVDMMNEAGYLMSVPGNHEFDFGMDVFLDLANKHSEYSYVSCNFINLKTGETVFPPYILKDFGGRLVAFVGVSTPESYTKSTPSYFQDFIGNYIYGFCEGNDGQNLYDCVQKAIDDAVKEGADYVIGVGHLGTDPTSSPWTSVEVIANTTGLSAFLDGHSHSLIDGQFVKDKDDNDVVLCSTGSKFNAVAEITLDLNSGVTAAKLITDIKEDDEEVQKLANDITEQFEDLLNEVVAFSEVDLIINDPKDDGQRLIRKQETNLGDFCADAYRIVMNADVAFINGGGIRGSIEAGDVTYGDVINIHPFGNGICLVEATGQEIMDTLEMAYRDVGEGENGGFLHVSGISCTIDAGIESSVQVDDKEVFVKVAGDRRVKDILINGEPIDPAKTYTVASHNYLLKNGGGGNPIFTDNCILKDEVMLDNQVLITYIRQYLKGVITEDQYGQPFGQGRITVVELKTAE